jgi:hypothetical protein
VPYAAAGVFLAAGFFAAVVVVVAARFGFAAVVTRS